MSSPELQYTDGATRERLEESQWQLESIQLVNFGPFDGYHLFDVKCAFDEVPATVVAGDSGTGKSTLEDAFFEVMTRNGSYNTASNEGGRGGSLQSEKRSLIGYVRGKLEDIEDEHGNPVAQLLRDGSCNRWSAVVLAFRSDADTVFTVAKLFWIAAGYNTNSDIKQTRITMRDVFDPKILETVADVNFTPERLRRVIRSEFKSFARVEEFLTYVYRVLKIDEFGQGKDVMDLLGRIRSGAGFKSINDLFREQVLDVPLTFQRSEEAAESYREHLSAWQKMQEKQARVDALTEVKSLGEEYDEALDAYLAHESAQTGLVFGAWKHDTQAALLTTYTSELKGARTEMEATLAATTAQLDEATAVADDLERQLNASGFTERLAAFDAAIERDNNRVRSTRRERAQLAREVEPHFGEMPRTAEEFADLKERVTSYLEGFEDLQKKLDSEQTDALAKLIEVDKQVKDTRAELAYFEKNKTRIPRNLGEARASLAKAAGMRPDELPFAAELMEVTDERWRVAIESVYGGFARTLLVSSEDFERFSTQIDRLRLRRRMTFRRVPTDMEVEYESEKGMLSEMLDFDEESPFAGWLKNTVRDENHDALRVKSARELSGEGRRVTINGQTRDGNRGAHGRDENAEGIIGLDNTAKIEQLRAQLVALNEPWQKAQKAVEAAKEALRAATERKAAAERIARFEFADIDVEGAEAMLAQDTKARQDFLDENEELGLLEGRLRQAKAEVTALTKQVGSQEDRLNDTVRKQELAIEDLRILAREEVTPVDRNLPGYILLEEVAAERLQGHTTEDNLRSFDTTLERLGITLRANMKRLEDRVGRLQGRIEDRLQKYLESWPDSFLSPTMDCMEDFMAQLEQLEREGFHNQKESWREHMLTWIKEDLIPLDVAYREARDEIDDKLEPINEILRTLPFGREGGRLEIVCRSADPKSARDFSTLMRSLLDYEREDAKYSEEAYHKRAERLMDIIAPNELTTEKARRRTEVLDRRRHVALSARVVDADDPSKVISTIKTLSSKSGGEVAEIVAFILGAALLYRLGQDGTTKPGFAPVLLDEGFIKADSRFTSRAISAWQGFGFQLIIAVPEEKYQSVVSKASRVLNIVADATRRSYVSMLELTDQPEDDAGAESGSDGDVGPKDAGDVSETEVA